jgi:CheY-like chemotaxis protein
MDGVPRSVLVVDDDVPFRKLLVTTLQSWGHTVVGEAGTRAEARAQSAALRPDTVLLDVSLPDGDGRLLAQELSAMPWRPRVVLISSDPDVTDDATARQMGAAGFVPKQDLPGVVLRSLIGDV